MQQEATSSSQRASAEAAPLLRVDSLAEAVTQICAVPPTPISDWATRACAGIASAFENVTACAALIDTRSWRSVHSGAARSAGSPHDPHQVLHTLRTHSCLRHASPTHGAAVVPWDQTRLHPFAKSGLPEGLVIRSVHTVSVGVLLAFWVHAPVSVCPEQSRNVLSVLCEFTASTARTLWEKYGPAPRWLTPAETDVFERLARAVLTDRPPEPDCRRELTIRNHVRSIASKTGLQTPKDYAAALGPIAAADTLRGFVETFQPARR
jgi:hypothetical protein